jgi:hypothetical protein
VCGGARSRQLLLGPLSDRRRSAALPLIAATDQVLVVFACFVRLRLLHGIAARMRASACIGAAFLQWDSRVTRVRAVRGRQIAAHAATGCGVELRSDISRSGR